MAIFVKVAGALENASTQILTGLTEEQIISRFMLDENGVIFDQTKLPFADDVDDPVKFDEALLNYRDIHEDLDGFDDDLLVSAILKIEGDQVYALMDLVTDPNVEMEGRWRRGKFGLVDNTDRHGYTEV